MKKTYKLFLALILCALGGMNAFAEEISLQEVPFCSWDGWTADARSTGAADCAWVIGESTGQPYGDPSVINYADLSNYSKLVIVATEGTPRIMLNRDVDEGQWNADESQSHLIEYPKDGGWSQKYFTKTAGENEGESVYTVDLKQIVKDKGFAHLHAIKGANWQNTTVLSMTLVSEGKPVQRGWTSIINNGDLEGDEVTNFFTRIYPDTSIPVPASEVTDGAGVDGTRGIVVAATAKAVNPWDNQFFIRVNDGEDLIPGAKYRISFDYKADADAKASTQAHAEPADYISSQMLGDVNFTTNWQHFESEGTISTNQSTEAKPMKSIAFNLNEYAEANNYYFDNFIFEVYKVGAGAEYSGQAVKIDFGFDTNLPELVKATGKKRLMFPISCATVKVNGTPVEIQSVEGFADGRFYIFLKSGIRRANEVLVTFTNPTDAAYHLIYSGGAQNGNDVANFSGAAEENRDITANEGYAYVYVTPTLVKADPEQGSFNLPNNIKEFKAKFDKLADGARMKATLNGQALTVAPAAMAEEFTFTREGADLRTGEYTLEITDIYPETGSYKGDTLYTFNVGKVAVDPNDTVKVVLPETYFANATANGIPEGYYVLQGEDERVYPNTFSSGSRTFNFTEGGDFTKGLYFREGYVQFGGIDGYELTLEAGKKYNLHFTTAAWKDNGMSCTFQILTADEEEVLSQTIDNKVNVNGSTAAVNGAAQTDIEFVPETTGNYLLKWSVGGFNEVLLANVSMKYIPSTVGVVETLLLNTALENAKKVRDANASDRYSGAAFDALTAAIVKYEAEKENYTAPSAYTEAAETLDQLSQAMKDHRANCDAYDEQIKKAIDVVRQNELPDGGAKPATKFVSTELFAQLKAMVEKYHGSSKWTADSTFTPNEEDPSITDTIVGQAYLVYTYDVLTLDEELTPAIAELKEIANLTSLLFTEGASAPENANGGKATGVAVLFDRIRLGIEALKDMGVDEEDELIIEANKALTDDDRVADALKERIKTVLYGELSADAESFFTIYDEENGDVARSYDMTVFVKNPNTYKQQTNMDFTEENVPGWITPDGCSKPGLTAGWGAPKHVEGVAEDVMFQTWGPSYRVEQTITDLPAGVYTLRIAFGERNDDGNLDDSYGYATTKPAPVPEPVEVEEGEEPVEAEPIVETRDDFDYTNGIQIIGQAFPFAKNDNACVIEDIVVTDGMLRIGANAGQDSHTFFNEVRLLITGTAAGFDYKKAYDEIVAGIDETVARPATVKGIQLFDLNGRRVAEAKKGIVIVKKFMNDGTIRTEKVVKK